MISIRRIPILAPLLTTALLTSAGCADTECSPGEHKCEGNTFLSCYRYQWRTIECRDAAPVCDDDHGCQKASSTGGEGAAASCTDDEQMCVGSTFYKCRSHTWQLIPCPGELPVCDDLLGCVAAPQDQN